MESKKITPLAIVLTAALFLGMPTLSAEDAPQMSPEMQAQMEKAKELGSPGAGHEVLKPLVGKWTVSSRFWMKPGEEPQKSSASSSIDWVMGGRFLKQKYSGQWQGQPFEGLGFLGYDNMKKEYVSVWMDNMATGLFESAGQYDKGAKTIVDNGTFSCPMTGETDRWFRTEWKIVNNDKNIFSMYVRDPDGKEYKSMELTYKRSK